MGGFYSTSRATTSALYHGIESSLKLPAHSARYNPSNTTLNVIPEMFHGLYKKVNDNTRYGLDAGVMCLGTTKYGTIFKWFYYGDSDTLTQIWDDGDLPGCQIGDTITINTKLEGTPLSGGVRYIIKKGSTVLLNTLLPVKNIAWINMYQGCEAMRMMSIACNGTSVNLTAQCASFSQAEFSNSKLATAVGSSVDLSASNSTNTPHADLGWPFPDLQNPSIPSSLRYGTVTTGTTSVKDVGHCYYR